MALPLDVLRSTPEQELRRLNSPYQLELATTFPNQLVAIINEYAQRKLGEGVNNWHQALVKINALPAFIPPLRPDILEILESTCPVYGAPFITAETHSLLLIPSGIVPGGLIDTIDDLASLCGEPNFATKLYWFKWKPNMLKLNSSKWILITNLLLPTSENGTQNQHNKTIQDLRKKTSADYKMPTCQEAFAANMLMRQVTNVGLWIDTQEQCKWTRVEESFERENYRNEISAEITCSSYNLMVGNSSFLDSMGTLISFGEDGNSTPSEMGIAAVRTDLSLIPKQKAMTKFINVATSYLKSYLKKGG